MVFCAATAACMESAENRISSETIRIMHRQCVQRTGDGQVAERETSFSELGGGVDFPAHISSALLSASRVSNSKVASCPDLRTTLMVFSSKERSRISSGFIEW